MAGVPCQRAYKGRRWHCRRIDIITIRMEDMQHEVHYLREDRVHQRINDKNQESITSSSPVKLLDETIFDDSWRR